LREESRVEMVRLAKEGQRLAEETLAYSSAARQRGESAGHVLNSVEFVMLFQFELNTCLKAVLNSELALEAKFHSRSLVLTVFESLNTLRRLLAKSFRSELVGSLGRPPGLELQLKSLHSAVNALFEDCNSRFGDVRDGLAAHRDPDPEVRLRLVERVDAQEAVDLAYETLKVLNMFHKQLMDCVQLGSGRIAVLEYGVRPPSQP
jgi:hypothetical protein